MRTWKAELAYASAVSGINRSQMVISARRIERADLKAERRGSLSGGGWNTNVTAPLRPANRGQRGIGLLVGVNESLANWSTRPHRVAFESQIDNFRGF